MRVPNHNFLLWLAGFWDGEGSFGVTRVSNYHGQREAFYAYAKITNTCREVLDAIRDELDVASVYGIGHYPSQQHQKPAYVFSMQGPPAIELARMLLPYLRIKGPQAHVLTLWRRKHRLGYREPDIEGHAFQRQLFEQCRELNQRGRPDTQIPLRPSRYK